MKANPSKASLEPVEPTSPPPRSTRRRPRRTAVARASSRVVRVLFRVLYGLVVAIFLIGYAAAYLPPRWFWWTGIVAVSVPYTSLLLLLLSGPALWRFAARGRLFHGALLLLVVLRFVPLAALATRTAPGSDDLRVMTFNAPVRGPNPEALARATVRLVRAVNPDVLALQEPVIWLDGTPPRRRMTSHIQAVVDDLDFWAPTPGRNRSIDLNQPVLTRFPLDRVDQIPLEPVAAARPNFVTRVRFRWKGREAVLYNLHLHTVGEKKPWTADQPRVFDLAFWRPYFRRYREAYLRRAHEVRQVRRMIEEESVPVIVVGDLNSTMHHWEYRQLAEGLRDAFTQRGSGWGATYHARLPLVRIDHILTGPEWEIVSAGVPDDHAFSDHRPVVARLKWRDPSP